VDLLLSMLIEWLSQNQSIVIKEPPQVVVMSHEQLREKYSWTMHAVYNRDEKIIYLSKNIDFATPQGASVLLHELVHHYQNTSGLVDTYRCSQQAEKLAYDVQLIYLQQNNATKLMPEVNPFNIMMLSLCSTP